MQIEFISKINQGDKENTIHFTAPVIVSKWEEFDVYEFIEVESNVANRIEISNQKVNIIAGIASIFLKLNEKLPFNYETSQGSIPMLSYLKKIIKQPNFINIEYDLMQNEEIIIGSFNITLKIID